jgi:uncharacterized protein YcaQ
VLTVSREDARRFFVHRQMLAPPRSLTGGRDAVLEVFRRLGSIQFDPIAVAGRNHDLVLHARVAGYEPAWTDELYERRDVFEAFNKGLSLVPMSEFPWFRGNFALNSRRVLEEHPEVAEQVLERIRAEAPLSVHDFERQRGSLVDWFGAPRNVVAAVLEALTYTGAIGLARRDGNRRYYDLIERLVPRDVVAHEIPLKEQMRHKMLSRFRAHGLLGIDGGGSGIFSALGTAKPDPRFPGYEGRTAVREELVADGELVVVTVEGVRGKRFVLRDEVPLLQNPPQPPPAVAFIPPFDPVVWDRPLLGSLFDFEYVWELFFPPEKRRWGWYTLPIVFGDRLIGRIEPRIDADGSAVEIIGLWWEDSFNPSRADGFVDALRVALHAYLEFARATKLEWAPQLAAEKRLVGARFLSGRG